MKNDVFSKDNIESLNAKTSQPVFNDRILLFLKLTLILFNLMLIIDDICLHVYMTPYTFYYYQLVLSQILIIITWGSLRNPRQKTSNIHIYLVASVMIVSSIVYGIYYLKQYGNDMIVMNNNELELFFTHELINNSFTIAIASILAYYQVQGPGDIIDNNKVEMLNTPGLIV